MFINGWDIIYPPFFFIGTSFLELEKKRTGVEHKLYELTTKIVDSFDYVLYDLEYVSGSSTLRVFIMDPETKTAVIEDCVKVDRAFDEYVEVEDWIPNDFVLEVSSPGMYRKLKTLEHFEMAKGQIILASITGKLSEEQAAELSKSLKSQSQFRGTLLEMSKDKILIETTDAKIELSFSQIKKASLDPDF